MFAIIVVCDKIRRLMAKQIDYTKLNPRKILRIGGEIKQTFNISELERLNSWLSDDKGLLNVHCRFERLHDDNVLMHMTIDGQLNPVCKRCLSAFDFNWHSSATFQFESEDDVIEGKCDESYESVAISHDGTINLIDIVTDEVILGLPNTHQEECMHELGHEF